MPLTQRVTFKTMFQRGNRIQVPRRVRWRFKMDSEQVLKVSVFAIGFPTVGSESFYAQMGKDGRITIPRIQRALLKGMSEKSLEHHIIEVRLEPA